MNNTTQAQNLIKMIKATLQGLNIIQANEEDLQNLHQINNTLEEFLIKQQNINNIYETFLNEYPHIMVTKEKFMEAYNQCGTNNLDLISLYILSHNTAEEVV